MKYFRELKFKETICPKCSGHNITEGGRSTTLVGWFGGPEQDPNHWTSGCQCNDCNFFFIKHWVIKNKSTWYTDDRYCIAGIPTCCEMSYKIICECGGWKIHSLIGKSYAICRVGNSMVPTKPRFWQCESCSKKFPDKQFGESFMTQEAIDNFVDDSEYVEPQIGFKVKEEIGMGIININGINTKE